MSMSKIVFSDGSEISITKAFSDYLQWWLAPLSVNTPSAKQDYPLGTLYKSVDGRTYRYVKIDAGFGPDHQWIINKF